MRKGTSAHDDGMCSAIEKVIKNMYRISDVVFFDLDFVGLQWAVMSLQALYAQNSWILPAN